MEIGADANNSISSLCRNKMKNDKNDMALPCHVERILLVKLQASAPRFKVTSRLPIKTLDVTLHVMLSIWSQTIHCIC